MLQSYAFWVMCVVNWETQDRLGHQVPIYDTLDGKTLVPYQCVMVRALSVGESNRESMVLWTIYG